MFSIIFTRPKWNFLAASLGWETVPKQRFQKEYSSVLIQQILQDAYFVASSHYPVKISCGLFVKGHQDITCWAIFW